MAEEKDEQKAGVKPRRKKVQRERENGATGGRERMQGGEIDKERE